MADWQNVGNCGDVVAIVVTYNPDMDVLLPALRALALQVGFIVIVDNASSVSFRPCVEELATESYTEIVLIEQSDNLGLGKAYNVGIDFARQRRASCVLLLDQDSTPESGMVQRLRECMFELVNRGLKIGGVGPNCWSVNGVEKAPFIRIGSSGFSRVECESGEVVEVDFLISSGSLLPMVALQTIGFMDESLFIDHVDTEWCMRAKVEGFRFYGAGNAFMRHSLGERRSRIWFFRWRPVYYHLPFRYYYIVRNSILLHRRRYMPRSWRRADWCRFIVIIIYYGLFVQSRFDNLRMMWRGVKDGLRGISGKMT